MHTRLFKINLIKVQFLNLIIKLITLLVKIASKYRAIYLKEKMHRPPNTIRSYTRCSVVLGAYPHNSNLSHVRESHVFEWHKNKQAYQKLIA